MSFNSILWQPKALRQLRKIDEREGRAIREAVKLELSDLSKARNVRPLVNHPYGWRLRVHRWRVFFEFDGEIHIISIEEIRRRDDRTY